jgi:hypothetical protein
VGQAGVRRLVAELKSARLDRLSSKTWQFV